MRGRPHAERDAPAAPSELVAMEIHRHTRGRHLLLLTDFDGTLAELAPTPAEAAVAPDVRRHIAATQALPSVTFGVVSGRRLYDVRERLGVEVEFAAGLHGLEIEGGLDAFNHPLLEATAPAIASILRTAWRALAWCPGLHLENKTYAVTCHVRRSPAALGDQALREFRAIAAPHLDTRVLKALPGARALELLPAADWHKGRAVEWIRARLARQTSRPIAVAYLGDDTTDEDAFAALGNADAAIGVGERPHAHLIRWRLAGPASVGRFLEHLARLRLEAAAGS